jgi:hypothetical protein
VPLCEFGDDGVGELLRRSLAAKVTGDGLALRNRLSLESMSGQRERKGSKDTNRQGCLLDLEGVLV